MCHIAVFFASFVPLLPFKSLGYLLEYTVQNALLSFDPKELKRFVKS